MSRRERSIKTPLSELSNFFVGKSSKARSSFSLPMTQDLPREWAAVGLRWLIGSSEPYERHFAVPDGPPSVRSTCRARRGSFHRTLTEAAPSTCHRGRAHGHSTARNRLHPETRFLSQ